MERLCVLLHKHTAIVLSMGECLTEIESEFLLLLLAASQNARKSPTAGAAASAILQPGRSWRVHERARQDETSSAARRQEGSIYLCALLMADRWCRCSGCRDALRPLLATAVMSASTMVSIQNDNSTICA